MAVISFSGRVPARKTLYDVGVCFSRDYCAPFETEAEIAHLSGLDEGEVAMALDCIAEHPNTCTLGHIMRELGEERLLMKVMALVGVGIVQVDLEALYEAPPLPRGPA